MCGRRTGRRAGRQSRPVASARIAVFATLGVVVLGVAAAFLIWGLQSRAAGQAPAADAAAAPVVGGAAAAPTLTQGLSPAEAALATAADALQFHLTTDASVGLVENLPADTTLLPPSKTMLPVGRTAPDFSLKTPFGDTVKLSAFKGKTVLLEFFATWCPHCQAEAQHLRRLYATLPSSNFAFLSVNADGEDPASLYAFHRFFGVEWPVLLDPATPAGSFLKAGGAGAVTRAYGVALYPTFYIIDPQGRVSWRNDREQPDLLLIEPVAECSRQQALIGAGFRGWALPFASERPPSGSLRGRRKFRRWEASRSSSSATGSCRMSWQGRSRSSFPSSRSGSASISRQDSWYAARPWWGRFCLLRF